MATVATRPSVRPAVDASMDLLNQIVRQPLDPDYALVAARGDPPPRRRWGLAVVALVIGAMFAVAALQTTRSAPALADRTSRADQPGPERRDRAGPATRPDDSAHRARSRPSGRPRSAGTTRRAGSRPRSASSDPVTGTVAVSGPGAVIVVDDATAGRDDTRDRVLDVDLQMLANGLWQAGAEAIAINGHRLSSLTAIRGAGDAITVDYRSLTRPYRIEAIGDPRTLQARFVESAAGAWWNELAQNRQCATRSATCAGSTCPADPGIVLRYATADDVDDAAARTAGRDRAGLLLEPAVPPVLQPYLPIAIVAAMDALFGAFRAYLEGNFSDRVFVVSFVSNVLIAAAIVFVGDQIGVGSQLSTAVVVVLGIRIFTNAAAIRRALFHA